MRGSSTPNTRCSAIAAASFGECGGDVFRNKPHNFVRSSILLSPPCVAAWCAANTVRNSADTGSGSGSAWPAALSSSSSSLELATAAGAPRFRVIVATAAPDAASSSSLPASPTSAVGAGAGCALRSAFRP